jgi:hypothetical protein
VASSRGGSPQAAMLSPMKAAVKRNKLFKLFIILTPETGFYIAQVLQKDFCYSLNDAPEEYTRYENPSSLFDKI